MADEQRFDFGSQISPGGFRADECTSALQKCIRRGLAHDAAFWASELDLAGFGAYVWRRLITICSEDAGAWVEGPAVIRALFEAWTDARKRDKAPPSGCLFLMHAVLLLADAPKSRRADDCATVMYAGERAAMNMTIPDFAVDHHTRRGRAHGATIAACYSESYKLESAAPIANEFEDAARAFDGAPPRRA